MSNHAARSAKRAKVAVEVPNVAVEVPKVAVAEVPKVEPLVDALLGDAAPAPLGTIFWHTQYGLQVEYGRHTEGGCRFEPSLASTARFSIYATRSCACAGASAPGARVLLTPDALAAKCAAFAPKGAPLRQ